MHASRHHLNPLAALLVSLLVGAGSSPAREIAVPEPLRPWKTWVQERDPSRACPTLPDGNRFCVGYGSLDLDLGDKGGSFTLAVAVFGRQWVVLPGDGENWPLEVKSRAGGDVPVVLRDGLPHAFLPAGEHVLAGRLTWPEMPGDLGIPERTARVSLSLRGKPVARPEDNGDGRLLLESKAVRPDSTEPAVPLTIRVYRKLVDDIPMRLVTRISLSVSGIEREIVTGRLLPEGAAVLDIDSDIPVRVESDGRLRAQLLTGDRTVTVESRYLAPVRTVAMQRLDSLWPAEEIWTFEAKREIRVVELDGAPLIDPSQSGLPEEWKSLPAYRLGPGDTLRITEKQRGDPSPQAGNLNLSRSLWLDFSGKGFTQKDAIIGELFRRSRLEMRPGFELGRAELAGSPVMITALEGAAGIEVPAGGLNLVALSRVPRKGGSFEATGWNQGFQSMQANLNLPPGWRLIHADGPDRVSNSWVSGWSLWEVFLLCILTLAVYKLAGWRGALLAFATFVLLSQEPGLPGLLWLNLLAAVGLCKVLPSGTFLRIANLYRWASLVLLAVLWIPFAIVHVRKALYPQLDGPGSSTFGYANTNLMDNRPAPVRETANLQLKMEAGRAEMESQAMEEPAAAPPAQSSDRVLGRRSRPEAAKSKAYSQGYLEQDAMQFAKVQTGPGEPAWGWESASLSWSGPVAEGEDLDLMLMPPWMTRIFRTLQAALPGLLLALLGLMSLKGPAGGRRPGNPEGTGDDGGGSGPSSGPSSGRNGPRRGFRMPGFRFGKSAGAAVLLPALFLGVPGARADFPSQEMLKELEERLSAPSECAPQCVSLNAGTVALAGGRIRVSLFFDAADTAVAMLPQAGDNQWSLEAIRLDGKEAASAARIGGQLAAAVPKGRHRIDLEARVLGNRLELVFGGETHNLSVDAPDYSVQGLTGTRAEGGTLVFQRRDAGGGDKGSEERRALLPDPILPFVEVHRTLVLGQEWILETKVVRIAPSEGAFSVDIPLLPFEHPLTAAMARDRDRTLVNFPEGVDEASWRSTVDRKDVLKFEAGDLTRWAEVWQVQATSRWHLETSGLAPAQALPGMGQATVWRPIPGDSLLVRISEPQAASGPVKTIESANLRYTPGRREGSGVLELQFRAGQGDAARLVLPAGARLDNLTVNGRPQPLTQREGVLNLPLQPGLQQVVLGWKQTEGIHALQRTPKVEVGDQAANIAVTLAVPQDRWVLFVGGPSAGPALLLWGVLVVLLSLAYGLGRTRATPLGFLDWALLFVGTSTVNVYATAPLLALFLALRWREKHAGTYAAYLHNLVQAALALLALVAFCTLLASVPQGLLSSPDMQITGNGSHAYELRWFMDRAEGGLPMGWMFSVPLWVYRMAMLAWSLWLAFRLLKWLRWCWDRFSSGGTWKDMDHSPKGPKPSGPKQAGN